MRLSQVMRKLLSCLKQLGGIWASPPSAVLPGLAYHLSLRHFPGKKDRFTEATVTSHVVPRPYQH